MRPGPAAAGLALLAAALAAPPPAALAAGALRVRPHQLAVHVPVGGAHMAYRHLGALLIDGRELAGTPLSGLSALAWDADDGVLYAVSDRGWISHLRPVFDGDTLSGIELLGAYRLQSQSGHALTGDHADAEGVAGRATADGVPGNARLVVSFERHPRLVEYDPRGRHLRAVPLPAPFGERSAYPSPNRGLEALADLPGHGLVAGTERPLRGGSAGEVPLVAVERTATRWEHALYDTPNNSLVALRALGPDRVLLMERGYGLYYLPIVVTLREARLPRGGPGTVEVLREIAVLDSSRGWSLDNFEGLAHHRGQRFFMVSDDNGHPLQRTLLAYFEVLDPGEAQPARDLPPPGAER